MGTDWRQEKKCRLIGTGLLLFWIRKDPNNNLFLKLEMIGDSSFYSLASGEDMRDEEILIK